MASSINPCFFGIYDYDKLPIKWICGSDSAIHSLEGKIRTPTCDTPGRLEILEYDQFQPYFLISFWSKRNQKYAAQWMTLDTRGDRRQHASPCPIWVYGRVTNTEVSSSHIVSIYLLYRLWRGVIDGTVCRRLRKGFTLNQVFLLPTLIIYRNDVLLYTYSQFRVSACFNPPAALLRVCGGSKHMVVK